MCAPATMLWHTYNDDALFEDGGETTSPRDPEARASKRRRTSSSFAAAEPDPMEEEEPPRTPVGQPVVGFPLDQGPPAPGPSAFRQAMDEDAAVARGNVARWRRVIVPLQLHPQNAF